MSQPPLFIIKVSMLFFLVILIIFCGLMPHNPKHSFISTNRNLATRSYEESFKNLILNKFNNNKTGKPLSITPVSGETPLSPPSLSSITSNNSSTTTTSSILTISKRTWLYETDDKEQIEDKKLSRESIFNNSSPNDDIKRKILTILTNKVRRRQHPQLSPSPTFDLSLLRRPHKGNHNHNDNDQDDQTGFISWQSNESPPLPSSSNESIDWSQPGLASYSDESGDEDSDETDHLNVDNSNHEPSISYSSSSSPSFDLDETPMLTTTFPPSLTFQQQQQPEQHHNNGHWTLENVSQRPSLNLSSSSQKIAYLFRELTNNKGLMMKNSSYVEHNNNNSSKQLMQTPSNPLYSKDIFQLNGSCENNDVVITISTNYEISSPNYPNPYPPNSHCIWHIQSQKDQLLKVQIFKLHIEYDSSCRFDRLDIKGVHQVNQKTGKTAIRTKRFCGHYLNGSEFDIGANHTTIEFHSDSYNQYPGFYLRIIAQSQDCTNDIFVHNFSYITSPNYPNSYENSKNCWTLVHTHQNHRLLVNFEDLHLEYYVHCEFDFIEIFDSDQALPSKLLGKFCTYPNSSKLFIHSTGNSLLFHFESDNYLTLRGYKAKIVALRNDVNISSYMECNWNADWQNMTISSPSYPEHYPIGSRCETSITAPSPNERVILLFDWIDLVDTDYIKDDFDDQDDAEQIPYNIGTERSTSDIRQQQLFNCSLDRLEIYESINDTEPSNVFCGSRSQPFRYVSKTDSIRLVFRSVSQRHMSSNNNYNTNRLRNTQAMISEVSPNLDPPPQFYGFFNPGFRAKFTFMAIDENSLNDTIISNGANSNYNRFQTDQYRSSPQSNKATQTDPTSIPETNSANNGLILVHRPENASVRLGSSHILYCEVKTLQNVDEQDSGQSVPIIWFKGDRKIHDGVPNNGTSLMIRQFTPKSVGRYICVYGDNSSDAWLTLKPDTSECSTANVLFRERPRDQFTSEGEFVMLHCSATLADSHQDVNITWQRLPLIHNHDATSNSKLKPQPVQYNSRIKKLSRGDLLFDRVLVEDSGYYFCVVRLDQYRSSRSSESFNMKNNPTDDDEDDCVLKSVARVQINRRVDVRDFCGRTSIKRNVPGTMEDVGKIIGGTEAQPGEFPWMVMFWDEKRHVFCGGALLNERWVVTAAHCFTDILDESTVFVKLGKYDQTESEPTEIVTKIQHTIKHPHFSNETFDNDIALVKLTTHIQFNDNILPICLATSSDEVRQMNSHFFSRDYLSVNDDEMNIDGMDEEAKTTKFGFVTGWGRLKENGPLPRYLHKIRLPIVDKNKCRQSTTFKVTDNMFCAGYGKEIVGDACKGDSGGPFVVEFHSRWTLLGIVSWGEGCGRPEKYGYYTKVNNYDNWIRRLTAVH